MFLSGLQLVNFRNFKSSCFMFCDGANTIIGENDSGKSTGLHRYFNDEQAIQILRDLALIKKDTEDEKLAEEFLQHFSQINAIDIDSVGEKNGALIRNGI